MATKKTAVKTTTDVAPKTDEVAELKNKLLEMQDMINKLMMTQTTPVEVTKNETPVNTSSYKEESEEIPFRTFIKVMSLTNNKLTISTEGYGKGTLYNFIDFGEIQPIMYEDVAKIIHNNQHHARNGAFYIMNPQVVKLHGLTNYYEKLLTKDTILNILNLSGDEMTHLFKGTTKQIQETIVSLLVERIVNDEYVDLNKLQIISNAYGKDINSMAQEIKKHNNKTE